MLNIFEVNRAWHHTTYSAPSYVLPFPYSPNALPSSSFSPPFISANSHLHSMYANPDVWCCLLSGQASSGSHLVDSEPIEEGSVIGCHINSNDGTVTFYRNDEYLLHFSNLNEHQAMRPTQGSEPEDPSQALRRGVRPFVCLETGGDSIYFVGSKTEETVVTFPESDPQCRSSFSGRVVNGNFDGLCEMHMWGQDGRWVGHYKDGIKEGTHLWVIPVPPPALSLNADDQKTPSTTSAAEDFIPDRSPGSVPDSSIPPCDDSPKRVRESPSQSPSEVDAANDSSAIGDGPALLHSTASSTTLPAPAPSPSPAPAPLPEVFTVISKFEVYEHGLYVRDLTALEIESDTVVLECRKSIEEEKEKILLERTAVSTGAAPTQAVADKKKKSSRSRVEKAKQKSGFVDL